MKFGLSDDQVKVFYDLVVEPLKKNKAQVFVFGSRARGQHHPFSDIDVLYVENESFPLSAEVISQIKEAAEESKLTIKVDLVNRSSLAKSYVESVEKDLVQL